MGSAREELRRASESHGAITRAAVVVAGVLRGLAWGESTLARTWLAHR